MPSVTRSATPLTTWAPSMKRSSQRIRNQRITKQRRKPHRCRIPCIKHRVGDPHSQQAPPDLVHRRHRDHQRSHGGENIPDELLTGKSTNPNLQDAMLQKPRPPSPSPPSSTTAPWRGDNQVHHIGDLGNPKLQTIGNRYIHRPQSTAISLTPVPLRTPA